MEKFIIKVLAILNNYSFQFDNEKELQELLFNVFQKHKIPFEKEYNLGKDGIIDFFYRGVGIEVKIKGQKKSIYRQCRRYAENDEIKALILLSSNSVFLPDKINDKDVYTQKIRYRWS